MPGAAIGQGRFGKDARAPGASRPEVIRTELVTKVFQSGTVRVTAVDGVSLSIREGEFVALVGPSGSGKTTLLNLIAGLERPTSGRVLLAGMDITGLSESRLTRLRRDLVGFVFQAYNLIPVLTVEENVEYVMLLQGVDRRERRRRVAEMLALVGLQGMARRFPPSLSGGQQQRVAIARAMVAEPKVILADEPTANLDSVTSGALLDLMRRLNQEKGMAFVFSTHDPLVMQRARRVVVLRDGKIHSDAHREA